MRDEEVLREIIREEVGRNLRRIESLEYEIEKQREVLRRHEKRLSSIYRSLILNVDVDKILEGAVYLILIIAFIVYAIIRFIMCFWLPIVVIVGISFFYAFIAGYSVEEITGSKYNGFWTGVIVFVITLIVLSYSFVTGGIEGDFLFEDVYFRPEAWYNLQVSALCLGALLAVPFFVAVVRRD